MYAKRRLWPRRILLVLTLAVATTLAWRWWQGPPLPANLEESIDAIVEAALSGETIAGASVGVRRAGRVIHAKGYGLADLEHGVEATHETSYQVGSITKQFTAALILALAEQGALVLDAPASHFIDLPPHLNDVTIESLLTHTSGVRDYTTLERWWEGIALERSPDGLIEVFAPEPLDFQPGSRFSYSNSGYVLLGKIIEQVTGLPYGGVVNERIAVPARLSRTRYCDNATLVDGRARGYQIRNGSFVHATYLSQSQAYAAGALCSTVNDLLRWSALLSGGGLLGRASYQRMSSPAVLNDGSPVEYGYGVAVGYLEGHRRISHVGGTLGFSSQIGMYDEDDLAVVVLTNTEGASAAEIETSIARLLLGLDTPDMRDVPLSLEELAPYEGRYDLGLTEIEIAATGTRLQVKVATPGLESERILLYQGNDAFQVEGDSEVHLAFERSGEGLVSEVVLSHRGITMRGSRIDGADRTPR